ncbi:signal peptidase I [Kitasatospora phosalacinea]|uniref:signal peptidase I n=1 Tax=Kitasatospora phosalacinea TaxID=2065 RepID=UPI00068DCC6B|nr:signal peptidase I [Kitasatospora phosalacinea]
MKRWSGFGKAALAALIVGVLFPVAAFGYGLTLEPRSFVLSGGSMTPTYRAGERITAYGVDPRDVRRGDVVLFSAPDESGSKPVPHFQRVIALGGDHVSQCGDQPVQLNGVPLDEPYLQDGEPNGFRCFDVTVPAGQMFVMGDHRVNSMDSRMRGSFPLDSVTGSARGDTVALTVIGVLFVACLPFLPAALVLSLLARRRRRTAPPQTPAYPDRVLERTP